MTGSVDLFWAKVERSTADGCWQWTAATGTKGYGAYTLGERQYLAHRLAYELLVGPIPEGLTLDHLCRSRTCVNPEHLEPVTSGENVLRGEGPSARNARKTECPRGHPYDLVSGGKRRCLACKRERYAERRA